VVSREAQTAEIANGADSLWWSSIVDDFKVLPANELPQGAVFGISFSTFAINVPVYLLYLVENIRKQGGRLIRARLPIDLGLEPLLKGARTVAGISSAVSAVVFVNATGLAAGRLMKDEAVIPQRGQTVLVKGEATSIVFRAGSSSKHDCVIIPRPGTGQSIVGVTRELDVWNTDARPEDTLSILEAGKAFAPELLNAHGDFDIIRAGVGLRPYRIGGPRVGLEKLVGSLIVHAYGHGGAGCVSYPERM